MKVKNNKESEKKTKSISKEDEILKLKNELKEEREKNLRLLAEFENFRKRENDKRQEIRDTTIKNFVYELLPTIENFEHSLMTKDNIDMFVKGVEYIHKNLLKVLEEHKVENFTPKIGEEFNPNIHEPVLVEKEDAKSGEVLNILKKGYKFKDKVLKPALVEVKKH